MRRPRILHLLLPTAILCGGMPSAAFAEAPEARGSAAQAGTVRSAIEAGAEGRIRSFYASRDYRPLWTEGGRIGPEAQTLVTYLKTARLDGLKPSSYKLDRLQVALADARGGDPEAVARADLLLSDAFSRYAVDTRRRAKKTGMEYLDKGLKPAKLRADQVLRAAAAPKSLDGYIADMGWMSPHYLRMREMLAKAEKRGAPEATLKRLRLNLERARILPSPYTFHIVVDAASGRLWYYEKGKAAGTMKVVVGKEASPTPMLAGRLQYAILNPYWNIPVDLAQHNIAPKILSGRTLDSMNIEALSDWSMNPVRLNQNQIDWNAVASGKRELRLRQLPGKFNSMGKVKFMFPNDDGIYLHDTPERDLFKQDDRHFSNGCIRLEDADGLGRWLMSRPLKIPKQPEQAVSLPAPVPVFLTYLTATERGGTISFLDDVYGRDGKRR